MVVNLLQIIQAEINAIDDFLTERAGVEVVLLGLIQRKNRIVVVCDSHFGQAISGVLCLNCYIQTSI